MVNHGINVSQQGTSVSTPNVAAVGIPFVIGCAPVQAASSPAAVGSPVLCTSMEEFKAVFGWSDDWEKYPLCEFAYSHFVLYGCQPAIFCNMLDAASMKTSVAAASVSVANHQAVLPVEAINSAAMTVKNSTTALVKDIDYTVFYDNGTCIVELLPDGTAYAAASLSIGYDKVTPEKVTAKIVAEGMEAIDECMSTVGMTPDLICAPGYSQDTTVAAVMCTKADGINGMFGAKALIDIDCTAAGATTYTAAVAAKSAKGFTDKRCIPCWPMWGTGDLKIHGSTHTAGRMAATDADNGGIPYESPSNKTLKVDRAILADGSEVRLTLAHVNTLGANGIMTGLNFMGGWVCWGNYTGCYPTNTDVKDYFIPISRMFDFVTNTIIKTFWGQLDKPMTRRLIDSVVGTCNIWLKGLVGAGYLLGAEAEFLESENSLTDLMAGHFKIHVRLTPPSPAQRIDFVLEYDTSFVTSALQS